MESTSSGLIPAAQDYVFALCQKRTFVSNGVSFAMGKSSMIS